MQPWNRKIFRSFISPSLKSDTELYRKARLIVAFGFLGALFGYSYAVFYLCIGHYTGAAIIVMCSTAAFGVPFLSRNRELVRLAGNLEALILTVGFFALGTVEGGVHGHAIAWLAAVPLCALLLADKRSALVWCVICFLATGYFCVMDLTGIAQLLSYPDSLHPLITAVGFMGLTVFMSTLGIIFETGRERAFKKLADARDELAIANEKLIRMHHEKDEFLGVAAHDLKNRIHVVKGLAELLNAAPQVSPEQLGEDTREIIHAARKMEKAVVNMLTMDAIDEGRFPLTLQVCDLGELARNVVRAYLPEAQRKKVEIEFDGGEPLNAQVDPEATVQVMDNLLSNAIKYSLSGMRIHVRTARGKDSCVFSVRDEGPGFSEEDKARLFGKFAKLSARPTGGETSSGLGLSIVKKIAEAMNGSVVCESERGKGATFIVTFPSAD